MMATTTDEANEKFKSSWIDRDLQQLQQQDITEQLAAFFGEQDADRFVNPKLQDETPSKLNLQTGFFQKPLYQQGAHTLWKTLRFNSTKKLVHETRHLHHDYVKPETAEHDGMLKHVEKYRQRVELMHRIARFNEAKTRQLVQTVRLPSISHNVELCSDAIIYSKREKSAKSSKSPVQSKPTDDEHLVSPKTIHSKEGIIRFMSEEELTVPGRFQERMEKLGVDSNIGISKPEVVYRSSMKNRSEPILRNNKSSVGTLCPTLSEKRFNKKHANSTRSWQPLTLNALAQYTYSIPAPGSGEFKSGAVEMWKPEIAAEGKE